MNSVATITFDTNASDTDGTKVRSYGLASSSPIEYAREIYMLYPNQTLTMTSQLKLALNNTALAHISWIEEDQK